ncbi:MAG: hypothetical protein AB8G22_03445 [Saprospiraceae bacterium]
MNPLRYYFTLSYRRLERRLMAWGVYPKLSLLLSSVAFIFLSKLLFIQVEWAAWLYCGIAAYILQSTATKERTERLQLIFKKQDYHRIRWVENTLLALPFLLFLVYQIAWLAALFVLSIAILFSFWQTRISANYTIPTPFKNYPFESIVGFRQTWWVIGMAYFLLFKAVQVSNFNLGAAALILIFFIQISNYARPERELFVWIFQHTPQQFLSKKIKAAVFASTILTLPLVVILFVAFSSHWLPILLLQTVGYLALISFILAKYSAYPREISLPQALLYALSLSLPPLLFLAIWLFYRRAKQQLGYYLNY